MKFKLLVVISFFISTLVMAQAPVMAPLVVAGTPSAGTPGANGGGVAKPAAAPVAVKPTPAQPKPAEKAGQKGEFTYTPTAQMRN